MFDTPSEYNRRPDEVARYSGPTELPEVTVDTAYDQQPEAIEPGYGENTYEGTFGNGYDEECPDEVEATDKAEAIVVASGTLATTAASEEHEEMPDETATAGNQPSEASHDTDEPREELDNGGILPPPEPPDGGDTLASPDDGDDEGNKGEKVSLSIMDLPSHEGADLINEFFGGSEVTPETRETFDGLVQKLGELEYPADRVDRKDFIVKGFGYTEGPRVEIICRAEEHTAPTGMHSSRFNISIKVVGAASSDPLPGPYDLIDYPLGYRTFSDGRTDNAIGNDQYDSAMESLRELIPDDAWQWLDRARTAAAEFTDHSIRRGAVEYLLNTAPDSLGLCRSTTYTKQMRTSDNTEVYLRRTDANPNYFDGAQGKQASVCELMLDAPDGVKYAYWAYSDGTEQMVAIARNETALAELRAQGFSAMHVDESSFVDAAARQMGVQRPGEALMQRFNELLRQAIK